MKAFSLALALLASSVSAFADGDGNRLTYLDSDDPFYPTLGHARFTTPQWVGEEGVEAVVILSIDDLRETKKYEAYLRPILERLKRIEQDGKPSGRAPFTIFCNELPPGDPQFQTWLGEGLSLDVHTLSHPCPLLGKVGTFEAAEQTMHGGVDLLAKIPGNHPVAFRMPCCDSMNSASPRFYSEIFANKSAEGRFLAIDSSVMCLLTPKDPALPKEITVAPDGSERFRKYFPMELVPPRKVTFERFAGYIEDYPYPYVIGGKYWEFPCTVPSDWEAFNAHGSKNPRTTEDWKAALDAIVLKQGVMTMVLHPHGWSDPHQIVELIDHAVAKHGKKVKFLNMREALERLEKNALAGQSLRATDGGDNGARLIDLNADGLMDVVLGNEKAAITRVWNPKSKSWDETKTPTLIGGSGGKLLRPQFGVIQEGAVTMIANREGKSAWTFARGAWKTTPELVAGLDDVATIAIGADGGMRLRDFDGDGVCELLASMGDKSGIFQWSEQSKRWQPAPFDLPTGITLLDAEGGDAGLRFVDLNRDGLDDIYFSNEQRFSIHLWAKAPKANLGWKAGWSHLVLSGERRGDASEPPAITRAGPHRNNGAWFKDGHLVVQNENTAKLEGVVDRRSFSDLIAFKVPPPKSPQDSLAAIKVRPGFVVELVAAEPLVVDPIAFEWDAAGRLYVVELRDYPLGMDGNGKPGGAVKLLEDTDGDTVFDKASTFLEDLPCPTGLIPWRKGLIVCAAPDIFYAEDTNGDGRADIRRVLFTGLTAGNQQHRANGFEWGLDGWIYGANGDSGGTIRAVETALGGKAAPREGVAISGRDFRFRPDTGEFEAESGATQFGRRRDDWGNWFGNNNSIWLWHYTIADHYLRRNPKLAVKTTRKTLANYASPSRVFAASEQPIRFNQPQSLGHVTSACSPSPYRDNLFGPDFATSVFISEPVHNVVHREVVEPRGATFESHRAADESDREFLASTDVWFRPAMLKTGPDGALYIADFYRFVLEHPEWIAPETQARLNLRAGEDKGRIYRVRPANAPERRIPNLVQTNTTALVAAMDSPSGWQRDTVQRLLFERGDHPAAAPLASLAREAKEPKARAQAIATLALLDKITPDVCISGLADREPGVRREALRASEALAGKSSELQKAILALENEPDAATRHQLALTLGEWKMPEAQAVLSRLAEKDGGDPEMRLAILSSAGSDSPLMASLRDKPSAGKKAAVPVVPAGDPNRAKIIASYKDLSKLKGDASRGGETFKQLCSVCHRLKGVGREIGPDLAMVAGKPDEWLLAAIFDPNQAVEDRYRTHLITMKDGTELAGIVAAETGNNITVRAADGTDRAILRSDMKGQKPLGRSLMPEGLEGALKPQDLADLIAHLRAP